MIQLLRVSIMIAACFAFVFYVAPAAPAVDTPPALIVQNALPAAASADLPAGALATAPLPDIADSTAIITKADAKKSDSAVKFSFPRVVEHHMIS